MPLSAKLHELQNLTPQQWLDRASQTAPQAVMVVLVIAIAWHLVQLTWLLLDRGPQPLPASAPPPMHAAPARGGGVDVQAIVNAHLFGEPEAAAPQNVANAPETQMNLVLTAVFAAEDPTKGLAIIGESSQSAKVFSVGSTVRPGTKLHAVYSDRVILDRAGNLEALALPKRSSGALVINRPAPRQQNQVAENLRRIAESNPSAFAEIIRPQPVFANGVQRGYRVYPGRNRAQFAKLGLMPGDLVLAINGTPLDDPQRGMEIFNTIGSADRVTVTVERNGQSQELTLNMAQLSLPDADADAGAAPPRQRANPRQPPAE